MQTQHVNEVMTANVVAVRTDAAYKEIADALVEHKISAVPVVDDDNVVVGVISEADLLHKLELATSDRQRRFLDRKRVRTAKLKAAGDTAEALMSTPAVTIRTNATIGEAARLLEHEQIKRLPVVDAAGRLIGIVARRDLLRPYLRADSAIREDVEYDVLERCLWVDPQTIDVAVTGGRVTLSGHADRRSTAEIAVRLTGSVDGVVAVVDELTWDFDDSKVR